ncbi:sugar lactone lactonase YvrE [Algoriphagus zhangzhouensis]|uniref:Sugar lactone lactonase YvrE n=2 Tax=Algoriphagus zhangzhouensis TaxID=1073327 RepID=A0A1M7ZFY1_9BACT|nr:sugar lactone lactonase YvrE [Algoriphagus zhangzhouensis]SHO63787.1 Sugar lactone lactonase YvrE [Algoriphagus zhangzhouensis]
MTFPSQEVKTFKFPGRLAVALEGKGNELILGLDRSLIRFDLETGKQEKLLELEQEFPLHRFNDGKVDPKGRIWIGTLSTLFTEGAGSLYCISEDLSVEKKLGNLTISNGMAWTEDQWTFYFIDTPTQQVQEFDFDSETGAITFNRIVIQVPKELGSPDGMCIDQEGMLWIAQYGGSGVYRWNPKSGELLDKIELPVPHVTSCAFGGPNLDQLLITTAQENLSPDQLKQFPQSGNVFLVKVDVGGFESNSTAIG